MQALTTCDELLLQMIVDNHYQTCEKAPKECLRCCSEHFLSILRFVKVDQCLEEETKTFINCVSKLCPLSFQRGRQEDSHELLINILNSLGEVESTIEPPDSSITIERAKHNKSESNKLSSIFTGQLCSSIRCLECQHLSNTREPFIDLELEINGCHSLSDALGAFCRVEALNGENRYDCSHCARRTLAEKYLRLEEIPSLLCIQLKRFVYNGDHGRKLMEVVDYSPYLDVKPFLKATILNGKDCVASDCIDGSTPSSLYELISVVEHRGATMEGGHYVAYIKRDGQWYSMDDSTVQMVSLEDALTREAYILMYEKTSCVREEDVSYYARERENRSSTQAISGISFVPPTLDYQRPYGQDDNPVLAKAHVKNIWAVEDTSSLSVDQMRCMWNEEGKSGGATNLVNNQDAVVYNNDGHHCSSSSSVAEVDISEEFLPSLGIAAYFHRDVSPPNSSHFPPTLPCKSMMNDEVGLRPSQGQEEHWQTISKRNALILSVPTDGDSDYFFGSPSNLSYKNSPWESEEVHSTISEDFLSVKQSLSLSISDPLEEEHHHECEEKSNGVGLTKQTSLLISSATQETFSLLKSMVPVVNLAQLTYSNKKKRSANGFMKHDGSGKEESSLSISIEGLVNGAKAIIFEDEPSSPPTKKTKRLGGERWI
eukprot:gene3099-3392_t